MSWECCPDLADEFIPCAKYVFCDCGFPTCWHIENGKIVDNEHCGNCQHSVKCHARVIGDDRKPEGCE